MIISGIDLLTGVLSVDWIIQFRFPVYHTGLEPGLFVAFDFG